MELYDYEKAADGPLVGDLSLVASEHAQREVADPGYYPSLNGAEIADARRSGIFPPRVSPVPQRGEASSTPRTARTTFQRRGVRVQQGAG